MDFCQVISSKNFGYLVNNKKSYLIIYPGLTVRRAVDCNVILYICGNWYASKLQILDFNLYSKINFLQLFGKMKLDDNTDESQITRNNNFRSFPRALMVLFRSATGEAWQQIMLSITRDKACDPESRPPGARIQDDDCASIIAIPYFVSFVCLCSFLVNLFPLPPS
jgi:hypothetical protein